MKRFTIEFTFIENDKVCHTTWNGPGLNRELAIRKAREWYGFDKDGIEVIKTEVLAGGEDND